MKGWGASCIPNYREDENYKRALFYATLALEEAFSVYRTALRKYAEERGKAVEKREVGEGPFKRVGYMADLGLLTQLAAEERGLRGRLETPQGEAERIRSQIRSEETS
jgi:hypothetical protein